MVHKYISSKNIIAKVYSDFNLQKSLDENTLIEWIAEALEYMEVRMYLQQRSEEVEIKNFKGLIPCDYHSTNQVEYCNVGMVGSQKTRLPNIDGESYYVNNGNYTIQYPYIHVDFVKDGNVTLHYNAIPVDKEGYPLVPDNVQTRDACMKYIHYKIKYAGWVAQEVDTTIYDYIKNEWYAAADKARGHNAMLDPDHWQGIAQGWQRLIPNVLDHRELYATRSGLQINKF